MKTYPKDKFVYLTHFKEYYSIWDIEEKSQNQKSQ